MAKRSFYVNERELDDNQLIVLNKKVTKAVVVRGCAGSGKSLIALHRVKQIQEENIGSFYFILFTKTLKQYMKDGIRELDLKDDRIIHFHQWKYQNMPSADFIIVDEIQDFSREDIMLFQSKANKSLSVFGDTAQQIYRFRIENPLSMDDIASLTKISSNELSMNYRLPKKIARLAEYISDIDDELEVRCKDEGVNLPKILKFNSLDEELDKIIELIKGNSFEDVGIFFQTNADVKNAKEYFNNNGLTVEAKYNESMDLNFSNNLPKLTTYHSSKGLQFETVFIPNCENLYSDKQSALYVAITRSYRDLFIMHSGNLSFFFDNVPTNLYETSLESKTRKRF